MSQITGIPSGFVKGFSFNKNIGAKTLKFTSEADGEYLVYVTDSISNKGYLVNIIVRGGNYRYKNIGESDSFLQIEATEGGLNLTFDGFAPVYVFNFKGVGYTIEGVA